jgi:hypothetical protein
MTQGTWIEFVKSPFFCGMRWVINYPVDLILFTDHVLGIQLLMATPRFYKIDERGINQFPVA